ncbi:hypothetical protein DPMN_055675 [Dreissena polymorpha]|uniref:Uncharacterized protein n=1 Tax=Dreissena polymorpha TaxID=45954 RepID=A0A9D4CS91_DREPO|nr:hypothetical protein DPMN_055675 [Dreissena polymorpha]
MGFNGFPGPLGRGKTHADPFSVAHVRPRTSKGIMYLLLLNLAWLHATRPFKKLEGRSRGRPSYLVGQSRSLSELTRQRKSSQSVNSRSVRAG